MIEKKFIDPNLKNKSKTVEDKIQLIKVGDNLKLVSQVRVIESVHFVLEATQTLLIKKNLFLILFMKNYAWSSKS